MTTTTIATYLLASDTTGRWLVVQDPDRPNVWRLPGRTVTSSDESPAAVVAAAVAGQTGLQLTAGPLLAVRWIGTAGTLALIFSSFVLDRAVDECEDRTWQMVSPQFAQSRLHPLIDQALADIPIGGPILYREQTSLRTRAGGLGRRGIRTHAHRTLDGSTIESTYPCCSHRGARLTPADVAKLDADPDQSVRRRCDSCGTPYDVYLIGPASNPQSLEWLDAA